MFNICQSVNSTKDYSISPSLTDQITTELTCLEAMEEYLSSIDSLHSYNLNFKSISENLLNSIKSLPQKYEMLDCSQPWLCFWILNSLAILGVPIVPKVKTKILNFLLNDVFNPESGGFGGGPGQMSHVASSYAAINTIYLLGGLDMVDKNKMRSFLLSLKRSDGSFALQHDGEVDLRASYCALSIANMLDILDDELCRSVTNHILQCQTFEGGFGAVPGVEAHGSYSYCAIAALTILGDERACNLKALMKWLIWRQMTFEGGFNGRANKLVDTCYSFWVCAANVLTQQALDIQNTRGCFNHIALSQYLIFCGQTESGLRDKPTKHSDLYHTMYGLAGLALCYHKGGDRLPDLVDKDGVTRVLIPIDPLSGIAIT